jgi:predicted deacetylase
VAPSTRPACDRLLAAVREVADVPLTLLVVPRYHCEPTPRAFVDWLDRRYVLGDEIALHGYTHVDDGVPRDFVDRMKRRHYTRGEGEFADLSMTEALWRLTAGMHWFSRQGFVLRGFVAPAWLMSRGTWEALRWADLTYTCTLRRLVLLPERIQFTSQSIVYSTSSAWRRHASLAWSATVAATLRHNPLMRLELHPNDAHHSAIRRSWQRLLERNLRNRTARTLADVAAKLRQHTDWDLLGTGAEFDLDDDEHERRGEPPDQRADRDVAGIVEPEHNA